MPRWSIYKALAPYGRSGAWVAGVARTYRNPSETSMTDPILLINKQAGMECLWFQAESSTEAILQAALRHLHAVVEGDEAEAKYYETQYGDG